MLQASPGSRLFGGQAKAQLKNQRLKLRFLPESVICRKTPFSVSASHGLESLLAHGGQRFLILTGVKSIKIFKSRILKKVKHLYVLNNR